jgi:hypothetical protein
MVEYSRTAVIAHISQATKGMQEGWGRPGKCPLWLWGGVSSRSVFLGRGGGGGSWTARKLMEVNMSSDGETWAIGLPHDTQPL